MPQYCLLQAVMVLQALSVVWAFFKGAPDNKRALSEGPFAGARHAGGGAVGAESRLTEGVEGAVALGCKGVRVMCLEAEAWATLAGLSPRGLWA
jgi:hypothetical protein